MCGKEGASGLESTPPYKIAWDEKVGETGFKRQQDGAKLGSFCVVYVIMGLHGFILSHIQY